MCEEGVCVDVVLFGEIECSFVVGFSLVGELEGVVFMVDLIDCLMFVVVFKYGVIVNVGLFDMFVCIGEYVFGYCVWLCVNFGFGYGYSNKINIGGL